MSQADLEQSLAALRAELDAIDAQQSDVRLRLEPLIGELEQAIATLNEPGDDSSLRERLGAHIESFEVEHPRVTNILNDIMVTLSNLGI
jgi:hypothetical protein